MSGSIGRDNPAVPAPRAARWFRRRPGLGSWRRWGVAAVIALITTLITCCLFSSLSSLEFGMLNRWLALRLARVPAPEIALVGIEREAIERFQAHKPSECTCSAIARSGLGKAVANIKAGGATVVVVDMVLRHACPYGRDDPSVREPHDRPLIAALNMPGETILAAEATPNPDTVFFTDPAADFMGLPDNLRIIASPLLYNPGGVVRGVSLIQTGAASDYEKDLAAPVELVGRTLPPLSLAAYMAFVGRPCDIPEPAGRHDVRCAGVQIPVRCGACIYLFEPFMAPAGESKHAMLINWVGPPGTFPIYRLDDVIEADPDQLAAWFGNKIVMIGSVAERLNTPYLGPARSNPRYVSQAGFGTMSGLEVHANALNTLLQRRFLQPAGPAVMWAVIFACALLTAVAVRTFASWPAVVAVGIAIAIVFAVSMQLLWLDYWLQSAMPAFAVLLSGLVTGLYSYARSRQQAAALEHQAQAREVATATIVHDLKQPLAAISGLASVIQMTRDRPDAAEMSPELVARIKRQVDRALSDIDELLVANPDRRLHLRRERFDVMALARDLAIAQGSKSTVHEIEVRGPGEGVWVTGDAAYLARAISNLMDNAIKYWPDGGTVLVDLYVSVGEAIITVTDGGIGMTPDQQTRIFERYERVVPEELNIPGTGIGLYSVKRIVEAHGGSITVHSVPGRGSSFTVRLPLQPTEAQAPTGEGYR